MEDNRKELLKIVTGLMLRVTTIEKVLQSEGIITKDRYVSELEKCTKEATDIQKELNSKLLS